jgi:hypothetical protein
MGGQLPAHGLNITPCPRTHAQLKPVCSNNPRAHSRHISPLHIANTQEKLIAHQPPPLPLPPPPKTHTTPHHTPPPPDKPRTCQAMVLRRSSSPDMARPSAEADVDSSITTTHSYSPAGARRQGQQQQQQQQETPALRTNMCYRKACHSDTVAALSVLQVPPYSYGAGTPCTPQGHASHPWLCAGQPYDLSPQAQVLCMQRQQSMTLP